MIIRQIRLLPQIIRYYGLGWLLYRFWYAFALRSGILRWRTPATSWEKRPFHTHLTAETLAAPTTYTHYRKIEAPPFFFHAQELNSYQPLLQLWDNTDTPSPITLSQELAQGKLPYYAHLTANVGFPPRWHTNPFTQQTTPTNQHWSKINDFAHGDIKTIWEPNRFTFAYALVRAYWRTKDETYPALFWQAAEDWYKNNPPNQGANWKCGQESSLRVMAWCFALYGFLNSPESTAERITKLAHMIALSGERIEKNITYALSQKNNHGLSEATGLWTIGILFPELKHAQRWEKQGRTLLEQEGKQLIYADGAFSQQSVNYQRLMLHDYLWCIRLADIQKRPFSASLKEHVARSAQLLYQLQSGSDGELPCYGPNDGSLILPLNNCASQDFRPIIQAHHYLNTKHHCYQPGHWNEDLLWLFGPQALQAPHEPPQQISLNAVTSGYYTRRSPTTFLFTRCGPYKNRPGHADMLHVDLWWQHQPIAIDAGTYSYNDKPPWNYELARTRYHNTVVVDDQDQMTRVGKFMWLPAMTGRVTHQHKSAQNDLSYWQGEHTGYQRLSSPVTHQRALIQLPNDIFLVLDRLSGNGSHNYQLNWLLENHPYTMTGEQITLHTPQGDYFVRSTALGQDKSTTEIRSAQPDTAVGWAAPHYYKHIPALASTTHTISQDALFLTIFAPHLVDIAYNLKVSTLTLSHSFGQADIIFQDTIEKSIVQQISAMTRDRQLCAQINL